MGDLRTITWADGSIDGGDDSYDSVAVSNGDLSVDSGSSGIRTDGAAGYIDLVSTKFHLSSLRHGKFTLLLGIKDDETSNYRRLMDWGGTSFGAVNAYSPKIESRTTPGLAFNWTAASGGNISATLSNIEKGVMHLFTISIDGANTNSFTTVDAGNIGGQSGAEATDQAWTAPLDRPNENFVRCGVINTAAGGSFTNGTYSFFFVIDLSTSDPTVNAAYDKALNTVANDSARLNDWDADDVWADLYASDNDLSCVCWKCDETISGTTKIIRYVSSGANLVAATFRDEVYGSELVTNGTFAADTDWAKSDGALTIGSGVATWSGSQSGNADLTPSVAILTANSRYQITYDVVTRTAGSVQILAGTQTATAVSAAGSYHTILECLANTTLTIRGDSSFAGTVDNVTCRKITTEGEGVSTLASELVANNADFGTWSGDDPSNWTVAGEDSTDPEVSEVGSGEAHGGSGSDHLNLYTSDTDVVSVAQNITTVVGDTYLVEVDINKITTGAVRVQAVGVDTVQKDFTFAGKARMIFTSDKITTTMKITTIGAAADFTIASISVKQVGSLTTSSGMDNDTITGPSLFSEALGLNVKVDDTTEASGTVDLTATPWADDVLDITTSIDPNALTMANDDSFTCIQCKEGSNIRASFNVGFSTTSGYTLGASVVDDAGTTISTSQVHISDDEHTVKLSIYRATSSSSLDAMIELYVDSKLRATASAVDLFDLSRIDTVKQGAVTGMDAGTTGTFYMGNTTISETSRTAIDAATSLSGVWSNTISVPDASGVVELWRAPTWSSQLSFDPCTIRCSSAVTVTVGTGRDGTAVDTPIIGPVTFTAKNIKPFKIVYKRPIILDANKPLVVDASGAGRVQVYASGRQI